MKKVILISDYTPIDKPNYLEIIQDDQGDYHMRYVKLNDSERNLRVASEGTRYSYKVRKALMELVKVIEEENITLDNS